MADLANRDSADLRGSKVNRVSLASTGWMPRALWYDALALPPFTQHALAFPNPTPNHTHSHCTAVTSMRRLVR